MEGSLQSNLKYVIMPWEDHTGIIFPREGNEAKVYSRWDLIQKMLNASTKIKNADDLVKVIKSYNVLHGYESKSQWNFPVLKEYFAQLSDSERNQFFEEDGLLFSIRNLSFLLKELVPRCEILKTGFNSSVKLHQIQIASILANAFFCTFPKSKADCPSINFNTLFEGHSDTVLQYCVEKIKCIVHYFKRVYNKQPSGILTFHRHIIPDHKFPRWDKTTASLCSLKVETHGKIEDQNGYIHMDFSNRYIGGGVLGRGCVQEEIRFVTYPELIAARLFTECLADNEALLIVGAERYCTYTGYSNTFCFAGDYKDTSPIDSDGQRRTYLTIIDALYFHRSSEQYRESKILRELKKAYVGFKQKEGIGNLPVATGNWGCGAFGGDPQLKSLLQIMASSQARRDMLYLTFEDSILKNQIEEIYETLKKKNINVGELYQIIRVYNWERKRNQSLFEFILASIQKPEKRKLSLKPTSSIPRQLASSEMSCKILNTSENSIEQKAKIENQKKTKHDDKGSSDCDISKKFVNQAMSDYVKFYGKTGVAENHNLDPGIRELPEENTFDIIWYENECGSSSGTRIRSQEQVKSENISVRISSSSFSEYDEKEKCCKESGNGNRFERAERQEATVLKKFMQPKITDFFNN